MMLLVLHVIKHVLRGILGIHCFYRLPHSMEKNNLSRILE